MLTIYGSRMCPDCVKCLQDLDAADVYYQYRDFSESLLYLKLFLSMRDSNPIFDDVKARGGIGIPCIVEESGAVSLTWEQFCM